jgi:hypothetical protein
MDVVEGSTPSTTKKLHREEQPVILKHRPTPLLRDVIDRTLSGVGRDERT